MRTETRDFAMFMGICVAVLGIAIAGAVSVNRYLISSAEERGIEAGKYGLSQDSNPYFTDNGRAWLNGWHKGREEAAK